MRRARPLLGTLVEIAVEGGAPADREAAIEAAFAAIARVHRLMSFHDADSDLGRLNREAATHPVGVHAWTYQVLEAAAELHRASQGAFDIAVAPVLQSMGRLPRDGGQPALASPTQGAASAVELLPGRAVRFRLPGVKIDLGGIAKGFAVDRAIEAMKDHGLARGLVNAGGDIAAFGLEPETIYIRHPGDPRRLLGRVDIGNEALASSGLCFDPFRSADSLESAIIDPQRHGPVRANSGATVSAPTCMVADALTKVVMIAGRSAAAQLEHFGARAILVSANGDIHVTSGWQSSLAA
jgi:thiamine biosynthesis lipoprotein